MRIFMAHEWVKESGVAITVTGKDGRFIEMNDKSVKTFEKEGGLQLIGTNMMDCHNDNSKSILTDYGIEKAQHLYR